ncbi:MAG: phosphoglucomutase/phosphomannomutase family protein [Chloroflexi bacterium]|nr:MAG: phosphoglucomutase/phosphomannomutase family protein [Chloroflexota bacterium]
MGEWIRVNDIRFGSDGWRGRIAEEYTFDNVRRVAQAVADYFCKETGTASQGIVVGYDCRFASEYFAATVAEVLVGNRVPVFLAREAMPTPIISFSALSRRAAGAVIITASHNPPTDNGFKVRDQRGAAIAPEGLKRIEARIPDSLKDVKRASLESGLVETFDPAPAYIEYVKEHVDLEPIKQAGLKVAYDAMWGVGAGWLARLLEGGATTICSIRGERNPAFPGMRQPEPIPPNVDALLKEVVAEGADVGIANDGDADRIGMADEKGNFVTQLQVGGLLALYLLEMRGQRGPIVKTLSSTVMINRLGQKFGLDVFDTGIGPKHVGKKFIETDAMLGATESGGFILPGLPERDGILAALYILDMMARAGKRPGQLLEWLYETVGARYYYRRIDTRFPTERREAVQQRVRDAAPSTIGGLAVTGLDTLDGFKFNLADGGWLLVRFSHTEPILRVYCETTDESRVELLLDEGLELAGLA